MTTAVELAERGHQLAAWVNFNGTFNDASGGQAPNASYACSGSTITITDTAHGLTVGDSIHAVFTRSAGDTTTITDDFFTVLTVPSVDMFTIQTVVATTDQSGSVAYDSDAATATAGSGPIYASYNVSSITDLTGSEYLVNFTNDMPDEHYCSLVTVGHSTTSPAMFGVSYPKASQSVSSFKFETWYYAGYNADSDNVSVAIFR